MSAAPERRGAGVPSGDEVGMVRGGPSATDARARWEAFVSDAPDLARRVRRRFIANRHHVIGTVRANGGPGLSGTEVRIEPTGVSIGMMAGSRKLADVRRDPRVELLLERVVLVRVEGDELVVTTWDPVAGEREQRRR